MVVWQGQAESFCVVVVVVGCWTSVGRLAHLYQTWLVGGGVGQYISKQEVLGPVERGCASGAAEGAGDGTLKV
jgi:hypothetical protein